MGSISELFSLLYYLYDSCACDSQHQSTSPPFLLPLTPLPHFHQSSLLIKDCRIAIKDCCIAVENRYCCSHRNRRFYKIRFFRLFICQTPPMSLLFLFEPTLLEIRSSSALILVGTSIDENIATFYDFLDNVALDCKFLLKGEYFGWNFQTFLNAKEIETFFDVIRNFLECRFLKNDLECTLEKNYFDAVWLF